MKHKGSICDYIEQRDKELLLTYRRLLREIPTIYLPELLNRVVNSPTSRFWVSESRASIVLSDLFRGKDVLSGMRKQKREMYEELFRRAKRMRQMYPTMSVNDIAWKVVNSPAPKFYIHPACAKIYIHYAKKK